MLAWGKVDIGFDWDSMLELGLGGSLYATKSSWSRVRIEQSRV